MSRASPRSRPSVPSSRAWSRRSRTLGHAGRHQLHPAHAQRDPRARWYRPRQAPAIVRLFIESARINAQAELDQVMADFPQLSDVKNLAQSLKQSNASGWCGKSSSSRSPDSTGSPCRCGVASRSEACPAKRVRRWATCSISTKTRRRWAIASAPSINTSPHRRTIGSRMRCSDPRRDRCHELNVLNLDRIADFIRLADDEKLKARRQAGAGDQRLVARQRGTPPKTLSVAITVIHRAEHASRLSAQHPDGQRAEILATSRSMRDVTGVLAHADGHMKPPVDTEPSGRQAAPGMFEISVPGPVGEAGSDVPRATAAEYNPYRRYPTVVTLHRAITTPEQQLAWWAGDYSEKQQMRLGQASRRGYIYYGPGWSTERQVKHEFSAKNTPPCSSACATPCSASRSTPTRCSSAATRWVATPPGTSPSPIPTCGQA